MARRRQKKKAKNRIVGLDVSLTSTGIAWSTGRMLLTYAIKPDMPNQEMPRYMKILDEIDKICKKVNPHVVIMEDYSFGSRGRSIYQYGELVGIIKQYFHINNLKCITIPPSSLKKFVTGKGNASKEDMCAAAQARFGRSFDAKKENDECDAFCLVKMFERFSAGNFNMEEKEIFQKIAGRFGEIL